MNDRDLIDFHAHILPSIDDGSRDERMTRAMLLEEASHGVGRVVATPHFYADRISMDRFLERRARAMEKVMAVCGADEALPEIVAGAEVYYFRGMGQADAVSMLCIGDTRTLLLELPFEQWDASLLADVSNLIMKQSLRVVLAHVERYYALQRDKKVWNQLMALPVTPQINAGSFLKKGGFLRPDRIRRFCLDFLRTHPDLIIGTDCHNLSSRPPNLDRGREAIAAEFGAEALERVDLAARDALEAH